MFGKNFSKPQNRIDSLVGAGTSITGNVAFSGGLRVDGEIKGNVSSFGDKPSTLVVSEHARIEGEISVSHLVINGTVIGPVSLIYLSGTPSEGTSHRRRRIQHY